MNGRARHGARGTPESTALVAGQLGLLAVHGGDAQRSGAGPGSGRAGSGQGRVGEGRLAGWLRRVAGIQGIRVSTGSSGGHSPTVPVTTSPARV